MTTYPGFPGSHKLWLAVVNRALAGSPRGRMLDVCCGECAVTRFLKFDEVLCCDVNPSEKVPETWKFEHKKAHQFLRNQKIQSADLVICSDGLEHFTFVDGEDLLTQMSRVGRTAIIFTPTGDTTFKPRSSDPHEHKSSWTPEDLEKRGWSTELYPDWHPTLGWGAVFAWKKS